MRLSFHLLQLSVFYILIESYIMVELTTNIDFFMNFYFLSSTYKNLVKVSKSNFSFFRYCRCHLSLLPVYI